MNTTGHFLVGSGGSENGLHKRQETNMPVARRSEGAHATVKPEQIADTIAQAIREGVFAPGATLVQEELAQRFQVSRSPIREALRILAAEGLAEMPSNGQGATVRRRTKEELSEIYDLRIVLETSVAPFVVENSNGRDVAGLRDLARRIEGMTDLREWMRANYEFHTRIFALAERPHTTTILTNLLSFSQPYSYEHIGKLGGQTQASQEHLLMVDAIEQGNAEEFARLTKVHLAATKERLVAYYSSTTPADPLSIFQTVT